MMMSIIPGVVTLLTIAQVSGQDAPVPVVLWHGMGDSAAGMVGIAVSEFINIVTRVIEHRNRSNIVGVTHAYLVYSCSK